MKYLVTLDITVEATSRDDAFEKVEGMLGSQTFCLYDAEAVEQCVQSDVCKACGSHEIIGLSEDETIAVCGDCGTRR